MTKVFIVIMPRQIHINKNKLIFILLNKIANEIIIKLIDVYLPWHDNDKYFGHDEIGIYLW